MRLFLKNSLKRFFGSGSQFFPGTRTGTIPLLHAPSPGLLLATELAISWAAAEGGQNVSREFGGGGNVLQSVLSKTTFGGLRNWGWSGRCLFLLSEKAWCP